VAHKSSPKTPKPGVTRSRTRGSDRLEQILEAAAELFYENGYAQTSVEDVASAVNLLKGSLYYYIDSKEDLLFRIVEDVHEGVEDTLNDAMAHQDLPPLDRLSLFARNQIIHNARNVRKIAVYHHEWTRLEADRLTDIRERRQRQDRAVVALLNEALQRGDVHKDLDVKLAASCVFATIIWPYTWYRPGSVSPERLARFCSEFILGGVLGAGSGKD
jgi:TetR/AcrR family transcriptional regulator, cholesterol catabolism regulator